MRVFPDQSSAKKMLILYLLGLAVLSTRVQPAQDIRSTNDSSQHTARFITVDEDAKLEVIDWGGVGRPRVAPNLRQACRRNIPVFTTPLEGGAIFAGFDTGASDVQEYE